MNRYQAANTPGAGGTFVYLQIPHEAFKVLCKKKKFHRGHKSVTGRKLSVLLGVKYLSYSPLWYSKEFIVLSFLMPVECLVYRRVYKTHSTYIGKRDDYSRCSKKRIGKFNKVENLYTYLVSNPSKPKMVKLGNRLANDFFQCRCLEIDTLGKLNAINERNRKQDEIKLRLRPQAETRLH